MKLIDIYIILYITCIQSIKATGNISSIAPISLENLFKIRPNNQIY